MPSGFDPRCPYDLSLDQFADFPAEVKPVWTFRRLNGAEFVRLSQAIVLQSESLEKYHESVLECLAVGLMGWRNQIDPCTGEDVAFDVSQLSRTVNVQEAVELIDKRLERGRLSRADVKN